MAAHSTSTTGRRIAIRALAATGTIGVVLLQTTPAFAVKVAERYNKTSGRG
jgi:hypothetical protein